jgi:hypothetical protein
LGNLKTAHTAALVRNTETLRKLIKTREKAQVLMIRMNQTPKSKVFHHVDYENGGL